MFSPDQTQVSAEFRAEYGRYLQSASNSFPALSPVRLSPAIAQRLYQKRESGRLLSATRVVQVVTRKSRRPIGQHTYQLPLGQMSTHHILGQVCQPQTRQRGIEREIDGV